MLHARSSRFVLAYLAAFFVASNLNWAVAEVFLNPWAIPRLEGFMRMNAGGADIARMTVGFAIPLLIAAVFSASLLQPQGWAARSAWAGLLVSAGAFFGTYTFISGWGNVAWWPLMVTAVCDTVTLVAGTLIFGFLLQWPRRLRDSSA